ncbi:MAG: DUF4328 domain-containing protein [Candidatus Limnocylindria bacterium]
MTLFVSAQIVMTLVIALYHTLNFDAFVAETVPQSLGIVEFDPTSLALGVVGFGVWVGAALTELAWLSRSVDNTWYLLGGTPYWSPSWSIGWWFIPGANLVMPFMVVHDLNRRMARGIQPAKTWLLIVWWVSGFAIGIAFLAAFFFIGFPTLLPPGPTLEEARRFAAISLLVQPLSILTTVLTLVVYLRIQRLAELREPYALTPPAPWSDFPPGWRPSRPAPPPPAPVRGARLRRCPRR